MSKRPQQTIPFFEKQIERLAYLWLLLSLWAGALVTRVLILLAPLLRRRSPSKDFLFFPYTPEGNIGSKARFEDYFSMLARDGFSFDVHYPNTAAGYDDLLYGGHRTRVRAYKYFRKVFWQRLRWVTKASRYRAVFFHRALFPEYHDHRKALLERLLRAYNNNVTADYYDANFVYNEAYYRDIARCCHKVTVVNPFLHKWYSRFHARVFLHDLSVDTSQYTTKSDYALQKPVRLFWTGMIENAHLNLLPLYPLLEELNERMPVTLVLVCGSNEKLMRPFVEHHRWSPAVQRELLSSSDIALYPASHDDAISRGKVAYKSLEYAASGLPIVASPQGLSGHFVNGEDVLVANNVDEWRYALERLISDAALREQLGRSARVKAVRFHDVHATYRNFIDVLNA